MSRRERDRLKVIEQVDKGLMGTQEAAERLRLSQRQVQRLAAGYRLRGDAALVAVRDKKIGTRPLLACWRSGRQQSTVHIYGKQVKLEMWSGVPMPSPRLDARAIRAVIFPNRSRRMNVLFSTDTAMEQAQSLELYAARFKIEGAFAELKTHGGMADCSGNDMEGTTYSLLRLLSVTLAGSEAIEVDPWWLPDVIAQRDAVAAGLRPDDGNFPGNGAWNFVQFAPAPQQR